MSESQQEIMNRVLAEAVEARQHDCATCGHPGGKHAFDVYPVQNSNFPCALSCTVCFDEQTKDIEKKLKS